nr:secondary thiamine-phosphate synthase enzyme YjbQ [uncultured Sphaerochaeta sp.]
MAVYTKSRTYELKGRMDSILLDDHIRDFVGKSGIEEGYVMVFVAGCVAALVVTENEPGIMTHDLNYLFEKSMGIPYGPGFSDGTPYRHHETWYDDNGSSHLRSLLLNHSLSLPVLGGEVMLGPWQNIFLVECDTGPRQRKLWFQIQGE